MSIRPMAPKPTSLLPNFPTLNPPPQEIKKEEKKEKKEEKKEKKEPLKIPKKEEKKEEEEKKEPTGPKIPKKKDKTEFEKKIESYMSEGSLKVEHCKKFMEIMENEKEKRIYLIKILSKSKLVYRKFIQFSGLTILKNWLNNSPSKELVNEILQV
jgi:hypothetical protein